MKAKVSLIYWAGGWLLLGACGGGSGSRAKDGGGSGAGGSLAAAGRDGGIGGGGGTGVGGVTSAGGFASGGLNGGGGTSATMTSGIGRDGAVDSPVDGSTDTDLSDGAIIDGLSRDGGAGLVDVPLADGPVPDTYGSDGRDAPLDATMMDAATAEGPVGRRSTCVGPSSAALANASLPPGFCAWTWAGNLSTPRGIKRNERGDMLVIERNGGRITLLHDDNGNGVSDSNERVVLATTGGLNHGIALSSGYLYASSASTVYRWAYTGGRQPLGSAQTVVTDIPSSGHSTRTLLFDRAGNLYVSVGSQANVDSNTDWSRIIRYPASALGSPSTFAQGEAFATGLRNEVGITLDGQGRIWGVENGSDNLSRADLGGDIHNDNPGEELNLFEQTGRFYGYPYCWTEYLLPTGVGMGRGTQWAYPSTMSDGTHTDGWCRNPNNVVPPALVMQAHGAPLDIQFYTGAAFPADMMGHAIVTFHGSWNRNPATGYKVVRIPFGPDGKVAGDPVPLLEYSGTGDSGSGWPHRPVGIETGIDGRLFITSDESGIVISVGHSGS